MTTKLMTAEDLAAMDDDGYSYELIDGELIRMSPAGWEHGQVAGWFARPLLNEAEETGLGYVSIAETGFVLRRGPDIVVAPDVAFTLARRLPPRVERQGFLEVPPDLVVEVVSPSNSAPYIAHKVALYLELGVTLVWVAHPVRQTVTVHRAGREPLVLGLGDELDGEDILPGLRIPIASVFR